MGRLIRLSSVTLLAISLSPRATIVASQQGAGDHPGAHQATTPAQPTPPYHKSAKEAKPFPPLMPPTRFADRPVVAWAYHIAGQIPGVLAQQPCYCHCDKVFGHGSLLDCFASDHTAGCPICLKEAFLAYQLNKQGKTPSEIREGIIHGDWQKIDINRLPR